MIPAQPALGVTYQDVIQIIAMKRLEISRVIESDESRPIAIVVKVPYVNVLVAVGVWLNLVGIVINPERDERFLHLLHHSVSLSGARNLPPIIVLRGKNQLNPQDSGDQESIDPSLHQNILRGLPRKESQVHQPAQTASSTSAA